MSKEKQKSGKVVRLAKRPVKKKEVKVPVEVIVEDCVLRERVIAEYRHEWKWWYSTKLFKVYHPAFIETPDNSRWVMGIVRTLGPIPAEDDVSVNETEDFDLEEGVA